MVGEQHGKVITVALLVNSPISCPVLVGRERHLETIERLLAQTTAGAGHMALVSGEDGIGKSRLLTEARTRAVARGQRVLQGECFEQDVTVPYALLRDLLRAPLAQGAPAELTAALDPAAHELGALLAAPLPLAFAGDHTTGGAFERERHRLFTTLAQGLQALATRQPLLLIVEDLHWSDEVSLEFLLFFAHRISSLPVLLLLSYRVSDDGTVCRALRGFLAELERAGPTVTLALAPLSAREVGALPQAMFQLDWPPRAEVSRMLYARTGGNPLSVEEMLHALVAVGAIFYKDGAWDSQPMRAVRLPEHPRETVGWRVARLSAPAREVLALAAVVGRRCDVALLRAVLPADADVLAESLRELADAHLLLEDASACWRFHHARTRAAVYDDLPAEERRARHHAVAAALAQPRGADTLGAHYSDLTYHTSAAGEWSATLEHARHAGAHALAHAGPRAAIEHFTHALEAARQLGEVHPTLLLARGMAYQALGGFEHARTDFEAALGLATDGGDRQVQWRILLALGALWAGRDYAHSGRYYQRASTAARTLGDPGLLARSFNCLGIWHLYMDQPLVARREHRKALEIYRDLGDHQGTAATLTLLGIASLLGGEPLQATVYYGQAIPLLRELGDHRRLAFSLGTLATCGLAFQTDLMVGAPTEVAESVRYGELALKLAHETHWRPGEAYALISLAGCLGASGEYARALALVQRGLALAEELEHAQWSIAALWTLGTIYRALLALPTARAYYERALARAREIGSWHWIHCASGYLATVCVIQGDFAQAEAVLTAAGADEGAPQTMGQRSLACARIDLALARGEAQLALDLVDMLLMVATRGAPARPIPRLARQRSDALCALGRWAEAEATLRAARQAGVAQGTVSIHWYLDVALARLLHTQRREVEAARATQSARALIEEVAVRVPDAEVRALFRQRALAMLPPSSSPASRRALKAAFDGLTAREREVAALIAQGKSNRAIAEILVVGERTAETHVGNILGKLGLSSRAQIVTWTAEKLRHFREL